uniref:CX domain-containing protein n=1 Tax=Trichuris muris TaxID=70415 RepID=A0A5S6QVP8_TRIMR
MSHENSVAKSRWTDIQNGGGQQNQPSDDAPMVVNWGSQVGAQTATRHLMYEKDDGPQSSYMRCYYSDINNYILCDKQSGCCDTGCCSRDLEWMGGVYVLIAFVIIIAVVGFVTAIVCYQRSKNKAKKEEEQEQYARSHYTAYPYHYPTEHGRQAQFGTLY